MGGVSLRGAATRRSASGLRSTISAPSSVWHTRPTFWLPKVGLVEKSRSDRVIYDQWAREGWLQTTPGPTVDYEFVAAFLWDFCQANDVGGSRLTGGECGI